MTVKKADTKKKTTTAASKAKSATKKTTTTTKATPKKTTNKKNTTKTTKAAKTVPTKVAASASRTSKATNKATAKTKAKATTKAKTKVTSTKNTSSKKNTISKTASVSKSKTKSSNKTSTTIKTTPTTKNTTKKPTSIKKKDAVPVSASTKAKSKAKSKAAVKVNSTSSTNKKKTATKSSKNSNNNKSTTVTIETKTIPTKTLGKLAPKKKATNDDANKLINKIKKTEQEQVAVEKNSVEHSSSTDVAIRKAKKAAAKKQEDDAPKQPQKITPNNRKIASKGQTKEEQIAKKQAFNKTRAKWFDHYMKGTLPGLYDLHISTDRNTLLSDDEQIQLAEFIQAGIAGKVMLNKVETEMGKDEPVHLQRTIAPDAEHILKCLTKLGYEPEKYISNRRELRKLERLVTQSESARFVFAEKNLGLVTMIAGRRKKSSNAASSVDFDDLVAEGMGGLMVAIDHYNPDTGYKFSTPAAWWIEQPIRNYLDSKIHTIHMPTHMNNIYKSIEYAKNALREKFPDDSYITDEAIAEYCQSTGRDITVEKIEEARMYRRETISYDTPFNENDSNDKSISELLSSDEDISLTVLDKIGGKDNFNRMLALIDDDKKREILRDWYSSKDMHDIVILSNVSRKHCLTKERVRQLKQEGEKELFSKISRLAKEKGVGIGEAVMVDDVEEETFMLM